MSSPATAAIARALARHGIAATLVRAGDTHAEVADVRAPVTVLNRSYEGAETGDGPSSLKTRKARWLLPASEAPFRPAPFDRLELPDETLTINRVEPGFAYGELVRYDLEATGQ